MVKWHPQYLKNQHAVLDAEVGLGCLTEHLSELDYLAQQDLSISLARTTSSSSLLPQGELCGQSLTDLCGRLFPIEKQKTLCAVLF